VLLSPLASSSADELAGCLRGYSCRGTEEEEHGEGKGTEAGLPVDWRRAKLVGFADAVGAA